MTDKFETLALLAEERDAYAIRLEAVEADLAKERDRRLGIYREQIRALVLKAYAQGASIAAIGRAYRSSDYKTIKAILDSGSVEIAALAGELAEAPLPSWFTIFENEDGWNARIEVDGAHQNYLIITLDDGGYMLDADEVGGPYDGDILASSATGPELQLYNAIKEVVK